MISENGNLVLLISFVVLNWTVWIFRRTRSIFYNPFKGEFSAKVSVVIPVFREKKEVVKMVIDSILKNLVNEIILVLDGSEKEMMSFLKREYANEKKVKPLFIYEPGKRPALRKGIEMSKYEIVVLVDNDTVWESENFLKELLRPFLDPKVGGVGSRQKVINPISWGQKIIDWNLDIKYSDYLKSDSIAGSVLCLSGRTAAYRREIILPLLNDLTEEYFLGHRCLGGDDARLTSLVLKKGYKTVYQDSAVAVSFFDSNFLTYLRQKVRWSRNSFRTYFRALFSLWPYKQKRIVYIISAYHTIFPGLLSMVGIVFFIYFLVIGEYEIVYLWIIWITFGRGIRGYSYLKKNPKHIYLLPAVVLYFNVLSFIKLFAFLTMTKERWSGSRGNYKIKTGQRI